VTHAQLFRGVAGRAGAPVRAARRSGLHPGTAAPGDPRSAAPRLVVNCPSCRRPVPYPGRADDGSVAMAECADPACDLYFDFDPSAVYAVRSSRSAPQGLTIPRPKGGSPCRDGLKS
jgi:hypothetical protein